MELIDKRILIDLTKRALTVGAFVRSIKKDKYFFQIHYIPSYFSFNFPNTPIDQLNVACTRLEANGYIEFCPTVYIKLKPEGANYFVITEKNNTRKI